MLRILCAALLVCTASVSTGAQAASRITFTRKELKALSPRDAATRIFGAVAAKAESVAQIKFAPVPPATKSSPWLQIVDVYLEPVEDDSHLCRQDMLQATFEPVDAAGARRHLQAPANYDPPTVLTQIDLTHFFADAGQRKAGHKVNCPARDLDYFIAQSGSDAALALDAFQSFREEIAKAKPDVPISCVVMESAKPCHDSLEKIANETASLISVESLMLGPGDQETVFVQVGNRDGDGSTDLYLTLSKFELTGIEVIDDTPETPPPAPAR